MVVTVLSPLVSPAERLRGIVPDVEIAALGPIIEEIEALKSEIQSLKQGQQQIQRDLSAIKSLQSS